MNATATKYIKGWLGLTRSTSVAIIHHPAVLDNPFLQEFRTKAKLSYLSVVTLSADPLIAEISSLPPPAQFSLLENLKFGRTVEISFHDCFSYIYIDFLVLFRISSAKPICIFSVLVALGPFLLLPLYCPSCNLCTEQ